MPNTIFVTILGMFGYEISHTFTDVIIWNYPLVEDSFGHGYYILRNFKCKVQIRSYGAPQHPSYIRLLYSLLVI